MEWSFCHPCFCGSLAPNSMSGSVWMLDQVQVIGLHQLSEDDDIKVLNPLLL